MLKPTEAQVQKVMQDTGMDWLQAYRHVQARIQLQQTVWRRPASFPLGKSAELA